MKNISPKSAFRRGWVVLDFRGKRQLVVKNKPVNTSYNNVLLRFNAFEFDVRDSFCSDLKKQAVCSLKLFIA